MADNRQELRSVNWNEVFSFTHIFKGFKMAIHFSKLGLALAAVLAIFVTSWAMDRIWSNVGSCAQLGEPAKYFLMPSGAFKDQREQWRKDRKVEAAKIKADANEQRYTLRRYISLLRDKVPSDSRLLDALVELARKREAESKWAPKAAADFLSDSYRESLGDAEDDFAAEVRAVEGLLKESRKTVRDEINKITDDKEKSNARDQLAENYDAALRALTQRKVEFQEAGTKVRGMSIGTSLSDYEGTCLGHATLALVRLDITSGLNVYQTVIGNKVQRQAVETPMPGDTQAGFLFWVLAAVWGMQWFVTQHWFYALIFLLASLATWALFGGAVHRVAALQAAREEKISIVQGLKFASGKFLSFFVAPLMPLAAIVVTGLLMMAGGLLGNLWGFGDILVGAMFFLAIALGLFIAFLIVGLVAGVGLMYPTIAVEGSDALDAISRSFSYVFMKPWRAGLYGFVALVYGLICYLFVRLFAFLALASTHFFVKVGIWQGGETLGPGADKLDVMWQAPTFTVFHAPSVWPAMSTLEAVGSFCISVWVYLVIGLVLAFAISYAACAMTILYYLLRQKVDATDLDDVYVEEPEEEFLAPPPAPPAEGPPAPAAPAEAPQTPPTEQTAQGEQSQGG